MPLRFFNHISRDERVALTYVDWAIIGIIAVSSLISLVRGFVKEALSLLIWVAAGFVAWMFGGSLAGHLTSYIETPSARVMVACAVLFIATLIVGGLVSLLLAQLIRITGLSGTDRFLGMFFGAARGALLVVVAVGLMSIGPFKQDPWWQQSVLVPSFLLISDWFKDRAIGLSSVKIPSLTQEAASPPAIPPVPVASAAAVQGVQRH